MKRLKRKSSLTFESLAKKIVEDGKLVEKNFEKIYAEPEIGNNAEGKWGSFRFEIDLNELPNINEGNLPQPSYSDEEFEFMKKLTMNIIRNRCTRDEQYGWTWYEQEEYDDNFSDESLRYVEVDISEEDQNLDYMSVGRLSLKISDGLLIFSWDFDEHPSNFRGEN